MRQGGAKQWTLAYRRNGKIKPGMGMNSQCQMERRILDRCCVMRITTGNVQYVSRIHPDFRNWRPETLCRHRTRHAGDRLRHDLLEKTPFFASLQLKDQNFVIIVVRLETARCRRRCVSV